MKEDYKKKIFPKVLIIGYFNQSKPTGITTKNMFQKWPKEKIAVASFGSINEIYSQMCRYYYCLGNKEIKYRFPFFNKFNQSKAYNISTTKIPNNIIIKKEKKKKKVFAFRLLEFVLQKTGLSLIKYKYTASHSFLQWISDFKPDIVYCTVEDLNRIKFIIELKHLIGFKLVVHIMDDWIHSVYDYTVIPKFWKKKLKSKFNELIKVSDLNLAISEKMSLEYQDKYKKHFFVFHNPVDFSVWQKSEIKKKVSNRFTFVYAGKINKDTIIPINDFIKQLEKTDFLQNVDFKIYTTSSFSILDRYLKEKAKKYYFGSVEYEKIPKILENADGLLLPLAFNKRSIKYTRLSMPTKVTEYMISRTPIFLYAPSEIAVTEYLKKYNCAYIVSDKDDLKDKLKSFISNSEKRNKTIQNAYNRATKFHEIKIVTEDFRELLISNLNKSKC